MRGWASLALAISLVAILDGSTALREEMNRAILDIAATEELRDLLTRYLGE